MREVNECVLCFVLYYRASDTTYFKVHVVSDEHVIVESHYTDARERVFNTKQQSKKQHIKSFVLCVARNRDPRLIAEALSGSHHVGWDIIKILLNIIWFVPLSSFSGNFISLSFHFVQCFLWPLNN